ncbi:MAG: exo-alpha-sialidase [Planctomycetes bacterium]|nr:exo-alpha-sialidase [Planctomycetota bacterium]
MPSITQLSDGLLIGCQNVGSDLASGDHRIEILRTTDHGKTWQNQGSIHSDDDPRWAYRIADIAESADGRLLLTASRFENTDKLLFDPETESLQRPELLLFWSEDRGNTWLDPVVVPVDLPAEKYTWNKAGRLLQFSEIRWMYTFETWKPEGYLGPPDQKAAAVFSSDQGQTWGELTTIADDPTGELLWWDLANTRLVDGRAYVMLWTHRYGTKEDLAVHWVVSDDEGRSWSEPQPTNLMGQVCCPIALPDGRVAAIYNDRHEPQGIRFAISEDLATFDLEHQVTVFDAKQEASLGQAKHENFLAEHQLIGFGKPQGILLDNGDLLGCYWCTASGVTHTRWVRIRI